MQFEILKLEANFPIHAVFPIESAADSFDHCTHNFFYYLQAAASLNGHSQFFCCRNSRHCGRQCCLSRHLEHICSFKLGGRLRTEKNDTVLVLFPHLLNDASSSFRNFDILFRYLSCALPPRLSITKGKRGKGRKGQTSQGDSAKIGHNLLKNFRTMLFGINSIQIAHSLIECMQ